MCIELSIEKGIFVLTKKNINNIQWEYDKVKEQNILVSPWTKALFVVVYPKVLELMDEP